MRADNCAEESTGAAAVALRGMAVATLVTGIVPLTSYSAGATVATVTAQITMASYSYSGQPVFAYTVKNTSTGASPWADITRIEIPEYALGDLNFFGYNAYVPYGWTATEVTTPTLTGATLPGGVTPGGYWDLQAASGYGLAPSDSLPFWAESVTSATAKANFAFSVYSGQSGIVDPPVPNTAMPEPATTAILGAGLAGLLGLRRRTGAKSSH
ncbi:MAG: PEP-CTERM sorting domain-containing protein [Acetobacteraceae bacterium]|nr:PEP-CTERM sorting domain-containing protein [Pseudomonadota bacterium]